MLNQKVTLVILMLNFTLIFSTELLPLNPANGVTINSPSKCTFSNDVGRLPNDKQFILCKGAKHNKINHVRNIRSTQIGSLPFYIPRASRQPHQFSLRYAPGPQLRSHPGSIPSHKLTLNQVRAIRESLHGRSHGIQLGSFGHENHGGGKQEGYGSDGLKGDHGERYAEIHGRDGGHGHHDSGYGHDDHKGGYGNDDHKGGYGHDDHKGGYGHDDHKGGFGHDNHKGGYGHDDHKGGHVHDDHKGGYGHDDHKGGHGHDDHKGYGNDHGHVVHKSAPYKGPSYNEYDFLPKGKAQQSKKGKYGDDPVKESQKLGYSQKHEYPQSHFGGFGGGGSSKGHKGKGYSHGHGGGYGKGGYHGKSADYDGGHGKGSSHGVGYGKGNKHSGEYGKTNDQGSESHPVSAHGYESIHHNKKIPNFNYDAAESPHDIYTQSKSSQHEQGEYHPEFASKGLSIHFDSWNPIKSVQKDDQPPIYKGVGSIKPTKSHTDEYVISKGANEYLVITPDQSHYILQDDYKDNPISFYKHDSFTADESKTAKENSDLDSKFFRFGTKLDVFPMFKSDPYAGRKH